MWISSRKLSKKIQSTRSHENPHTRCSSRLRPERVSETRVSFASPPPPRELSDSTQLPSTHPPSLTPIQRNTHKSQQPRQPRPNHTSSPGFDPAAHNNSKTKEKKHNQKRIPTHQPKKTPPPPCQHSYGFDPTARRSHPPTPPPVPQHHCLPQPLKLNKITVQENRTLHGCGLPLLAPVCKE